MFFFDIFSRRTLALLTTVSWYFLLLKIILTPAYKTGRVTRWGSGYFCTVDLSSLTLNIFKISRSQVSIIKLVALSQASRYRWLPMRALCLRVLDEFRAAWSVILRAHTLFPVVFVHNLHQFL